MIGIKSFASNPAIPSGKDVMEKNKSVDSVIQDLQEELPYLFQQLTSNTVVGFDSSKESNTLNLHQPMATPENISSPNPRSLTTQLNKNPTQGFDSHQSLCTSISMPCSSVLNHEQTKRVQFSEEGERNINRTAESPANPSVGDFPKSEAVKFISLPISSAPAYVEGDTRGNSMHPSDEEHQRNLKYNRFKDKRFDSFKTWSGKLERQISHLVGIPPEPSRMADVLEVPQIEAVPVDRYYDALEGPELNLLRASEELVLPKDKLWPFLLRFPISSFGICLGIGSQAILWKALASSPSTRFLHVSSIVNYILWSIAICVMAVVSSIYILKVIFFFEAVRREYYHPIRVNFFFAPWISSLFLVLGLPPHIAETPPTFLWFLLMAPILCLNLKIYGQWMSGGQRRLSKVANPSNHLAIIGNFVGALLGASMGLTDGPIFFFAIGLAHYTVLFVTLYQRLPTNETLPKELHPVFFLFVAAPSVASMAWANLQGKFDYASRISYFISLFLYVSLAVRVNFFRGFTFSLAWWAYTFPMTGASIATIKYANEVQNPITQSLLVILSAISTVIVTILLITTIIHAFVLRNLFPNDIAIAISRKKTKASKRHSHKRYSASVDANDIEATLGPGPR